MCVHATSLSFGASLYRSQKYVQLHVLSFLKGTVYYLQRPSYFQSRLSQDRIRLHENVPAMGKEGQINFTTLQNNMSVH